MNIDNVASDIDNDMASYCDHGHCIAGDIENGGNVVAILKM